MSISNKYKRRIQRFLKDVEKPVCFVRMILKQKEVEYIVKNAEYIHNVIIKWNDKSSVVFIAMKSLEIPENFPFKVYQTEEYRFYGNFREALKNALDSVPMFLDFCKKHYDTEKNMKK